MSSRSARPQPPSFVGETVGKYEILQEIGRGAMACVYLGRDTFTDREVAVKIANPDPTDNEKRARIARKLFFNEAKAAGLLQHPNIVELYDAGVQEDIRYIVMEYVRGDRTLFDYTQPNTLLPFDEVVDLALKCAIAFDYAHRKGIIHRDIKPKNILLTDAQEVKIADFGVAMVTSADAGDTQVTGHVGSPLYMSPEQLRGENITNQADLFSLGVVLYELLCGRHPFAAPTIEAIVQKISREPYVPISDIRPDVPPLLSRIVDRALKKHPAGRYGMGLDMAGDLSLIFEHISVSDSLLTGQERFAEARRLEFFELFSDAEVWEVLNACVWRTVSAGTEIIAPDKDVDSFYVLVKGSVIIQRDRVRIETLPEGSCFGEIGYLSRAERTASAIARSDVTYMRIRRGLIEQASENCRLNLLRAFLEATTTRLAQATGRIVELESGPAR